MLQLNNQTHNVGIYCRLSRDDGNDSVSMSIENQKESLAKYVKDQKWNIVDVYIDDGFSGTSYDRPGFNRLIKDIEHRKLDCIVCKDLSRMGRNYLLTGYYTEEYFPSKNVRFIAVNDNFDSSIDNEFAPFKNIINEWYARDISKKIKFSFDQKKKKPLVKGEKCVPLYGYMHTNDLKRIPNPETAPVVKRIYDDYIKGKTIIEIANDFLQEEVYSPGYYNHICYNYNYKDKFHDNMTTKEKCTWRKSTIYQILNSVEYLGTLVNRKTERTSFKNKKIKIVPEEDRYIFNEIFEPLISKEQHELVQKKLENNRQRKIGDEDFELKGVLYCNCCNKPLSHGFKASLNKIVKFYRCRNHECSNKAYINMEEINTIVLNEIGLLSEAIINHMQEFLDLASKLNSNRVLKEDDSTKIIQELQSKSKKTDIKIQTLFEANLNDEIPYASYISIMEKYKEEKSSLEKRINKLLLNAKSPETANYIDIVNRYIKLFIEQPKEKYLNKYFLSRVTNKILVSRKENKKQVVRFTYNDSNLIKEFLKCKN